MACRSSSKSQQYPIRSISLPSRLNPLSTKVELQLNKPKTWETSVLSKAPVSSETIQIGLIGLSELYNCVDEFIQSPLTQKSLLQHQDGSLAEEALEVSIGLLDSCDFVKDLVSTMKEHVQELQSALRRKSRDSCIEKDINTFISFRKKVKKDSSKGLRALKQIENRTGPSLLDVDYVLSMVVKMLGQVASLTISVFRSLFLFFSGSVSQKNLKGWFLISKLMTTKSSESENYSQKTINEVESIDSALQSLRKVDVQMLRRKLQTLDDGLEGLENELECLYRRLIQSRVSLLNILAC